MSEESCWDRAYRLVREAREAGTRPDPGRFEDLTKAVGSRR